MNHKEYLIIFLLDVSLCYNRQIEVLNDEFQALIQGFIKDLRPRYKETMDKVFDIKETIEGKKRKILVYANFETVVKYGMLFCDNPLKLSEIYDSIGDEELDKIMDLAIVFSNYVTEIYDLSNNNNVKS